MSAPLDPRLTLARADLAAAELEGVVGASAFASSALKQVVAASAPVLRTPDPESDWLDELVHGERFDALGEEGGYVWGQARRDGYVGYVPAGALAPAGAAPTHRVSAERTYAFARPSIKARAIGPFSLNALVAVEAEEGAFSRGGDGAFFWTAHLAPIGSGFETDPVRVAERFLGAPYLWGGRTSLGLDCSGLVQQAYYACGKACPRDTDLQAALGVGVARDALRRGDLVCWKGHIGLMLDETRLLHANAHHMAVAIEPLAEAIERIEAAGHGAPTAYRRV